MTKKLLYTAIVIVLLIIGVLVAKNIIRMRHVKAASPVLDELRNE